MVQTDSILTSNCDYCRINKVIIHIMRKNGLKIEHRNVLSLNDIMTRSAKT